MLMTEDENWEHVTSLLNQDWVLVEGQSKYVAELEDKVYPPKTKEALDFQAFFCMTRIGFISAYLGKKTPRLHELLAQGPDAISDQEWDNLIAIEFLRISDSHCGVHLLFGNSKMRRSDAVGIFIQRIRQSLSGGRMQW